MLSQLQPAACPWEALGLGSLSVWQDVALQVARNSKGGLLADFCLVEGARMCGRS